MIDASLGIHLDNPGAKIQAIKDLFPTNLLPPTLTWNAHAHFDLNNPTENSYSINQTDQAFSNLLALFRNPERAIIDKFLSLVDQYNPIPKTIQDVLAYELPVVDISMLDLLRIPDSAKLLFAPEESIGKSVEVINQDLKDNRIQFNLDFLEAENIVALLMDQPAKLISLDVAQTLTAPTTPIPIVDVPVFSFFGLVNVFEKVDLVPNIEFIVDAALGIDTQGFFVEEASLANPTLSIQAGFGVAFDTSLEVLVVPIANIIVQPGLRASGNVYLSDNDAQPGEDFRFKDIIEAENWRMGLQADLELKVTGKLGLFTDLPELTAFEKTITESLVLLKKDVGTLQDLIDSHETVKEEIRKIKELLHKNAEPIACGGAILTANPLLMMACGASIIDDIQVLGDKIVDWAKGSAADARDQLGTIARDPVGYLNSVGDKAVNEAKELGKSFQENVLDPTADLPGVRDVVNLVGPLLADVGETLAGYAADLEESFGNLASASKGDTRERAITVQNRYSYQVEGPDESGVLWITPLDDQPLDVTIGIEGGYLVIDGPDVDVPNEVVAYKEKMVCEVRPDACRWEHENDITRRVVHRNMRLFHAPAVLQIKVTGTDAADSIIIHDTSHLNGIGGAFYAPVFVEAMGGDDEILAGPGADTIYGGSGVDTIYGMSGGDTIYGFRPTIGIEDEVEGDFIYGGDGVDTLYGQGGADELHGQEGIDTIWGGIGDDTITGGIPMQTITTADSMITSSAWVARSLSTAATPGRRRRPISKVSSGATMRVRQTSVLRITTKQPSKMLRSLLEAMR